MPHQDDARDLQSVVLLQSWKEIANHLGVSVRTAQEWERTSGLPIYRESTSRKGRIVAYSNELDQWRAARRRGRSLYPGATLPTPHVTSVEAMKSSGLVGIRRFQKSVSSRWSTVVISILVLGVMGGVSWALFVTFFSSGAPVSWRLDGTVLRFFDAKDRFCWGIDSSTIGLDPNSYSPVPPSLIGTIWKMGDTMINDLDEDGESEVLVRGGTALSAQEVLICLSSEGEVRWKHRAGKVLTWQGRVFSEYNFQQILGPFSAEGRHYLLVCARENRSFPCQVALVDVATGQVVQEYWHPGDLGSPFVLDLDGDGRLEVLLGATNNPGDGPGHAGIVLLDVPMREVQQGVIDFRGEPGGRETRYILFPNIDAVSVQGQWAIARIEDASVTTRRIVVRIQSYTAPASLWAIYELDFDLHYCNFWPSDGYRQRHQWLEKEGVLDHPLTQAENETWKVVPEFETAPDGNSPEVNAIWRIPPPRAHHATSHPNE